MYNSHCEEQYSEKCEYKETYSKILDRVDCVHDGASATCHGYLLFVGSSILNENKRLKSEKR